MFVKNDSSAEKRYYNGKIGRVVSIGTDSIQVHCSGDSKPISVNREEWLNTRYAIHPETKEIRETVEGKFVQYPLKTAWAITIHKSQGLTFERAVIDVGGCFYPRAGICCLESLQITGGFGAQFSLEERGGDS